MVTKHVQATEEGKCKGGEIMEDLLYFLWVQACNDDIYQPFAPQTPHVFLPICPASH